MKLLKKVRDRTAVTMHRWSPFGHFYWLCYPTNVHCALTRIMDTVVEAWIGSIFDRLTFMPQNVSSSRKTGILTTDYRSMHFTRASHFPHITCFNAATYSSRIFTCVISQFCNCFMLELNCMPNLGPWGNHKAPENMNIRIIYFEELWWLSGEGLGLPYRRSLVQTSAWQTLCPHCLVCRRRLLSHRSHV